MSAIIRLKRKQFGIFNVGANFNAMKTAMSAGNKAQALKSGAKMVGGAVAKTSAIAGGTGLVGAGALTAAGFSTDAALTGKMGSSNGLDNW